MKINNLIKATNIELTDQLFGQLNVFVSRQTLKESTEGE